MSTIVLSQADNGKTIELNRGDTLYIRLPENPTTGYRWAIDSDNISAEGSNVDIMTVGSSSYATAPGVGAGGGGERTFEFKAAKTGTTHLKLKHWQPWEGDRSVIDRYSLTIHMRE